jgi:beta-lactamase regulating signal transducer with metallopeptidase domain
MMHLHEAAINMNLSDLFNSYFGIYIAQSFCHSIIAFITVDRAIFLWNINNPLIRQRFRLIVVLTPVFSFPVYQIINPERNSISFRMGALFDINRWLNLEFWGAVPISLFFIIILLITTLVFFFQELIPVIKHTIESRKSGIEAIGPDKNSPVSQAVEGLFMQKPDILVLDEDEFIVFSTTGRNASVYLSRGVINVLNTEQLQAVIAHELAHIERNKKPLLTAVFILRILMFFNPVVLLEFRKIIQEEEKICDDMAVSLTKNPRALSESLKRLHSEVESITAAKSRKISDIRDTFEEYSHNLHLKSRIMRLEMERTDKADAGWFEFALTIFVVIAINYFIV